MLHDMVLAHELALRDVVPMIQFCATSCPRSLRPRNNLLAMTMKNDGYGSMSMELRERAFGPRKLRYKVKNL